MNSRIESLGILRLALMAMVFCCHIGIYSQGGTIAVMYFFVLSGFCAYLGYCNKVDDPNFSFRAYLRKKYVRIYPQHWFCTILIIILLLIQRNIIDIPALVANTLLVQSWVPLSDYYFSFNGVSWFISDLCFFVLISPILVRMIKKATENSIKIISVSLFLVYILLYIYVPKGNQFYFTVIFPITRLIDYTLGMALCRFFLWFKEKNPHIDNNLFFIAPFAFLVSVAISLFVPSINRLTPIYLIPISTTIFFLCTPNKDFLGKYRITHMLFNLSKYTLAFYLVHQVVLKYVDFFFGVLGIDCFPLYGVISLLLATMMSWLMFNCFESKKWISRQSK